VKEKGGKLTVTYNKNKERGESLSKELDCELAHARDAGMRAIDVLINCSPVGMSPNITESPFLARDFKEGMVVFDSVYNPLETRLLREANQQGVRSFPAMNCSSIKRLDSLSYGPVNLLPSTPCAKYY
jgi:3-dehydroquinate dehydratase / shikimate dehydrogenase